MPFVDGDMFDRLCRARRLLREGRPVREVAEHVVISPFHFSRLFQATFGVTPGRYRTDWQLDRARRLLRDRSVTGTCLEVGFASLGSFSARFSRQFGEAPSSYRRRDRDLEPGCLTLMANSEKRGEAEGGTLPP